MMNWAWCSPAGALAMGSLATLPVARFCAVGSDWNPAFQTSLTLIWLRGRVWSASAAAVGGRNLASKREQASAA